MGVVRAACGYRRRLGLWKPRLQPSRPQYLACRQSKRGRQHASKTAARRRQSPSGASGWRRTSWSGTAATRLPIFGTWRPVADVCTWSQLSRRHLRPSRVRPPRKRLRTALRRRLAGCCDVPQRARHCVSCELPAVTMAPRASPAFAGGGSCLDDSASRRSSASAGRRVGGRVACAAELARLVQRKSPFGGRVPRGLAVRGWCCAADVAPAGLRERLPHVPGLAQAATCDTERCRQSRSPTVAGSASLCVTTLRLDQRTEAFWLPRPEPAQLISTTPAAELRGGVGPRAGLLSSASESFARSVTALLRVACNDGRAFADVARAGGPPTVHRCPLMPLPGSIRGPGPGGGLQGCAAELCHARIVCPCPAAANLAVPDSTRAPRSAVRSLGTLRCEAAGDLPRPC